MFVLHYLASVQKALRLNAYQEFFQSVYEDRSLLNSFVTGDATWCFQYDLQTKDDAWNGAHQSLQDTKIQFQKSKDSVVCQFFDKEFIPIGHMVNKDIMWKYCLIWFKELIE